jgi:hypothetical protein
MFCAEVNEFVTPASPSIASTGWWSGETWLDVASLRIRRIYLESFALESQLRNRIFACQLKGHIFSHGRLSDSLQAFVSCYISVRCARLVESGTFKLTRGRNALSALSKYSLIARSGSLKFWEA